jgi:hypothetical protein
MKILDEDIFEITEIHRNSLDTKKKDKIYYVEILWKIYQKLFFKPSY